MADRIKSIITPTLTCSWSNLTKPDVAFGEASANHNITVELTPEFEQVLTGIAKENGCKKINGIYEKDGVRFVKFKSKQHVANGAFPCQDSTAQYTDAVPFKGDLVRLRIGPAVVTKPVKAMSFYLNGVQIVQKNSTDAAARTNGFDAVDGGYVGNAAPAPAKKPEAAPAPAISDEDIPF